MVRELLTPFAHQDLQILGLLGESLTNSPLFIISPSLVWKPSDSGNVYDLVH